MKSNNGRDHDKRRRLRRRIRQIGGQWLFRFMVAVVWKYLDRFLD